MPVALDGWLSAQVVRLPVVLAVDDLHWSDEETLDALMYVLAGPDERRLGAPIPIQAAFPLGLMTMADWAGLSRPRRSRPATATLGPTVRMMYHSRCRRRLLLGLAPAMR